ncbi:TetR/AcrR family transcriptional regulator [Sinirhodobacter hankyongi]|uniref:TetR/AcrR family transcriptional regulator n=1 Tax=Paenirhodobacter hankyongi TaxID=2294033 RepID=A0A421BLV7_9RHOB|nr:TetR/AcrR family transcriptional regulator [Sinirhodobacter hankyongi]RLL64020.1 TetR/AcrR family transcriptional regulator [Sinirhodobacter hankyongi]
MALGGLRERNKRRRAEQVLDAAALLFRERGYEGTHIEAIAEQALVAPATVYNYFATKPNLLMGLALRHVRASLPERRDFLRNLPEEPLQGVIAFESLLARQAMRPLSRECWRVILSAPFLEPEGPASRTGARLHTLILRHYIRLVLHYQAAGKIRASVDATALAEIIVGLTTQYFGNFVAAPSRPIDSLLDQLEHHIGIVLQGVLSSEASQK